MRVIYTNGLGEEINSRVLAEFTQVFDSETIVQSVVVEDRTGKPVIIRREECLFL